MVKSTQHSSMIFSLTGPQSSGKSTLLNYLNDRNSESFDFVPEVTRLVMRSYNLPINEDGTDLTQWMIINQHMQNALIKRDKPAIFDRCMYDGLVYTEWLYSKGKVSHVVNDYARYAFAFLKDKYDVIFYASPEGIEIEDDGERSTAKEFRNEITELFNEELSGASNIVVLTGSVNERLYTIKSTLEKLGLSIII